LQIFDFYFASFCNSTQLLLRRTLQRSERYSIVKGHKFSLLKPAIVDLSAGGKLPFNKKTTA